MSIRFYNARIMTMAKGTDLSEGEVWTEGRRIDWVGSAEESARQLAARPVPLRWEREIDCHGNLLMPGFKDAHTHTPMTFLRSFADDLPLLEWLEKQVFPMEARLTPEDVYQFTRLGIMEYLTSGITAAMDMYMFQDEVVRASVDTGFRTVLVGSIAGGAEEVKRLADLRRRYHRPDEFEGLIRYELGFHAQYTASEGLLRELGALAGQLKAPVYTHNAESKPEVENCLAETGRTPTVYLDSFGLFDYGGGAYHAVHVTDDDIAIFKEKKVFVISNPGSNTKLASGIAPIERYLEEGVGLALGTDGPASNNCLDMFREMFLCTGLAKLRGHDASAVPAETVLEMATIGGARAMRLPDCETLSVGQLADMILIDLRQPNMQPLNNIAKNLVYSGSKQNVALTMVNGQILYENGHFEIGVEPEEVYERAGKITARIKREAGFRQ